MYLETGWLRINLATSASIWDKRARTAVFNLCLALSTPITGKAWVKTENGPRSKN